MKWIVKAAIQKLMAALPRWFAEPLYYQLQRRAGRLRRLDPFSRFEAGAEMAHRLTANGGSLQGKRLLEIGTGWRLNTPLALWLLGADVVTVDLNRFLRLELIHEDARQLVERESEVLACLAPFTPCPERWSLLRAFADGQSANLERLAGISYLAPQDAARLSQYEDGAFYGSFSFAVLEHIPPGVISEIFLEAARVTDRSGLSVHMVDHEDHFAQTDPSISSVNFLRFSEARWKVIGGNRLAYCNRLRSSEVAKIFSDCGYQILEADGAVDEAAVEAVASGRLPLWGRFAAMPAREVATSNTWYVLKRD